MSWSLRISNGDLVLDGAAFGTVANENKLVQDFRHYLLTHMGSDPDYVAYGSLLDGGTKPNGQYVESVINEDNWATARLRIESEIRRVGTQYQRQQIERAKRDRDRYNKSTLTLGEVLASINEIAFSQLADALYVTVFISSGRNNQSVVELQLAPVITR